jgi:uncharacterized membrane protein
MFKAIGWLIKTALFAGLVLVIGNLVNWRGRTISDQVKTQLSHAERTELGEKLKDWTSDSRAYKDDLVRETTHEAKKLTRWRPHAAVTASEEGEPGEQLPSSERQKLRALIRELNSPQNRN